MGTLGAGPGVYICEECVTLSSQLISSKPKSKSPKPVQRIAPWDAETGLDAIIASLPRVAQARHQADYVLTQYVRKGRQLGATWAAIGEALGMARQSAWGAFLRGGATPHTWIWTDYTHPSTDVRGARNHGEVRRHRQT